MPSFSKRRLAALCVTAGIAATASPGTALAALPDADETVGPPALEYTGPGSCIPYPRLRPLPLPSPGPYNPPPIAP